MLLGIIYKPNSNALNLINNKYEYLVIQKTQKYVGILDLVFVSFFL